MATTLPGWKHLLVPEGKAECSKTIEHFHDSARAAEWWLEVFSSGKQGVYDGVNLFCSPRAHDQESDGLQDSQGLCKRQGHVTARHGHVIANIDKYR